MDHINDDNINDFFGETNDSIAGTNVGLLDHQDYDKKEIGDRVIPIDSMSISHVNGSKFEFDDYVEYDNYKFFAQDKAYYIVIATREKATFSSSYKTYHQDLIIVHPKTKKQYRINSLHVKLLN